MSNETEIKKSDNTPSAGNGDSWTNDAITIGASVVIVFALLFAGIKFGLLGDLSGQPAQSGQSEAKVLIFSMQDWISGLPEGSDEKLVNKVFLDAKLAAERAAKEGYFVVRPDSVIAYPAGSKLMPGMFGSKSINEIALEHEQSK